MSESRQVGAKVTTGFSVETVFSYPLQSTSTDGSYEVVLSLLAE